VVPSFVGIFYETLETESFFVRKLSPLSEANGEVKNLFDAFLHQKSDVHHEVCKAILG
jgi:hypothetical protein